AAQQGESGMLGLSLALSGISLTVAGLIGVRAARQRLKNQAVSAAQAAQMMLIAQLGQQDDATLERLTRSGGASAESARMILQGRHLGNPAGRTRPHTSELE
ncbi:MAG: hypothetical protein SGI84_06670, partial [Gemmatimonadota bacterium]|nr:hypothetical protein [Gemmatimonadota bacterium]